MRSSYGRESFDWVVTVSHQNNGKQIEYPLSVFWSPETDWGQEDNIKLVAAIEVGQQTGKRGEYFATKAERV